MSASASLKGRARAFFAWWLAELRGCAPPRLLRMVSPTAGRLLIDLAQPDSVAVIVEGDALQREIARMSRERAETDEGRRDIHGALALLEPRRRQIVARLPARTALRKRIELPSAAAENLADVLAFDMERQTPFSADQVYFTGRIAGRNAEQKKITVELTATPKALADPALALAERLGLAPEAIEVAAPGEPPRSIPLMRDSVAVGPRRGVRLLTWGLGVAAAALLVAALALPLVRGEQTIAALEEQVAQAKKQADAVRRMREDVDAQTTLDEFLIDKKRSRPPVIATLDEVSRVLPDDTWLFRIRVTSEDVQVFGYSAAASNLVGPLDRSELFKEPQFRAPLMREPRVDAERFHIGFHAEAPGAAK